MTGRQVVAITEILKKVFNDGAYKGVADLTPYAESIGKIFELDSTDDGPEVSILRQPRIKAVSESKQGMFGIFFTSFRGEEIRSVDFPGTYYQKSHAESIIAEKSTSTFRYYIKEIL